jgi:hypothetical protein
MKNNLDFFLFPLKFKILNIRIVLIGFLFYYQLILSLHLIVVFMQHLAMIPSIQNLSKSELSEAFANCSIKNIAKFY